MYTPGGKYRLARVAEYEMHDELAVNWPGRWYATINVCFEYPVHVRLLSGTIVETIRFRPGQGPCAAIVIRSESQEAVDTIRKWLSRPIKFDVYSHLWECAVEDETGGAQ